ncbi:MAG: hypothetical protein HY914_11535 [Desulfomonile tiedjei]|nr:hypothetical protein [Desulfomonile tiedjei]
MRGEAEMRYRYISRTGPNDLFGNADYAQAFNIGTPGESSIGLAGPNMRYVQAEGYSVKGSDAAYHQMRLWLYPTIKINEAASVRTIISLSGNLNGSYARQYSPELQNDAGGRGYYVSPSENWATNPHYSGWIMPESRDIVAGVPIAAPMIQALWFTLKTPLGTMVYGRRPAGFGVGWVVHEKDTYATSLSLIVPYGPLTFVWSQYLHDSGEDTDPNNEGNVFERYWQSVYNGRGWPHTTPSATDQNKVVDWNQAFSVIYQSGNLDIGAMVRIVRWSNVHSMSNYRIVAPDGPVGTLRDDALSPTIAQFNVVGGTSGIETSVFLGSYTNGFTGPGTPLYGDMFFMLAVPYLRYNNGRFFLNAEYDLQTVEIRRTGGRPISGRPQAWAVETGWLSGPLKISVANFYRSGHDRRTGTFHIRAPEGWQGGYDGWNFFLTRWGGGEGPIRPYNFLMGLYGTGNNSFDSAGNCKYQDFIGYAARLDLAVAANLNVFGAVLRAARASNTGTPVGLYDGVSLYGRDRAVYPFRNPTQTPNVPDTDLGWEIDAGLDWKFLENVTFRFLFARWQPGAWFKWAYQDRSRFPYMLNPPTLDINPDRAIDPIIAVQTGFMMDF